MSNGLWLAPIPEPLREEAVAEFEAGDSLGFLITASNDYGMQLVDRNSDALKARGMYEEALLNAFINVRVNHHRWPESYLRRLFEIADRDRLLAAGDPLPSPGPFTIYRGVGGRGPARRVRGLSWSASEERARWFAKRAQQSSGVSRSSRVSRNRRRLSRARFRGLRAGRSRRTGIYRATARVGEARPSAAADRRPPMIAATWRPRLIRQSALRATWSSVLDRSEWRAAPGITHQHYEDGDLLEYRDDDGALRGMLAVYSEGEVLAMTDPAWQRRSICTRLFAEADRRGIKMDFDIQAYTRAGARTVRHYLRHRGQQQQQEDR